MRKSGIAVRGPNYARKHKANVKANREKTARRNGEPGKCGIVRLTGAKLAELRRRCFERDGWKCVECPSNGPLEMAHIRTKRNNGDTLENVKTMCHECHMLEHNPKSVPAKAARVAYGRSSTGG